MRIIAGAPGNAKNGLVRRGDGTLDAGKGQAAAARGGEIGRPRRRVEDERLVRGRGRFADDFAPERLAHACLVRSPHAHARIRRIDASRAAALPGVLAVLTGADAAADGMGPIPHNPDWTGGPDVELRLPEGFEVALTPNLPLPVDRVRYCGEAAALVVAETAALAADAADLVAVDYEPLPAVTDARAAMAAGAPQLWPGCPDNLALTCEAGDREAVDAAFAGAAYVVALASHIHRVNGVPMEPRSVIGSYDAEAELYTLRTASGRGAVQTRERLAAVLGVPAGNCRVVFGDMGGNFGTRNAFSPEFALMPWAARRTGRPVKWVADRRECFLSDYQARDLRSEAALALDEEGNFLALRGVNTLNLGAYTVYFWPLRKGLSMMQGPYRIPAVHFRGHAALTNTAPTAVYRSAGRPEAIYMVERLIDLAAGRHGFDRVELRRRNLVAPEAMPFTNAVGVTYDSGAYAAGMEKALEAAGWAGFEARRAEARRRGLLRGIAVANYIEVTSGIPRERAELRALADGAIELVVGTMSSGQGHETSFAQLVADWLGVPFERIRYVANDTDRVSVGGGSHSGRSMRLASIAIDKAVASLLARARAVAADALQAAPGGLAWRAGAFRAAGGASLDLAGAAALAGGPLEGIGDITDRSGGYPYGAHVCEVEVDPETGFVQVAAWTAVDDVGLAVNPLVLHGQAQGAVAQGLGQALMEAVRYTPEDGQLVTGSFMDYAMPRADTVPPINTLITEVPAFSHPFGIRPGGEGGTTPALGLVANAVCHALRDLGVRHMEMPLTPERVWRAVREASQPTRLRERT